MPSNLNYYAAWMAAFVIIYLLRQISYARLPGARADEETDGQGNEQTINHNKLTRCAQNRKNDLIANHHLG